ncbi:MAG: hypothetical protein APF84_19660 [Gracilibacter sp. BRH_c7a]|nr:MAG: hypothetical protein APF84_19660 [Gracilibacter sp. BRH_c7a]
MRKTYWFLTVSLFFLGILVGVAGYIVWETSIQPGTHYQEKDNATKIDASKYQLPLPSVTSHDLGLGNLDENDLIPNKSQEEKDTDLSAVEQEKIISDYKQNLGILFDAWKAEDISTFKECIAEAYTGQLMETHIQKAEKFLSGGTGLYIDEVSFDDIRIETADKHSATVKAIYRYTVRDYDLAEKSPRGEEFKHFVHVRANLIKMDSRWLITGETSI